MPSPILAHGLTGLASGLAVKAGEGAHGPWGRYVEQYWNQFAPNECPALPEILWAVRTGLINPKTAKTAAELRGIPLWPNELQIGTPYKSSINTLATIWSKIYESQEPQPATGELLTALNRGTIDVEETSRRLQRAGFSSDQTKKILLSLRYEVPGPSDLVRFAVRHVFEPDLIKELGYNDEFRPILDAFHRAQGVDYPIFSGPLANVVAEVERESGAGVGSFLAGYRAAGLPEPTWAKAYWWSHWILPSPTQGYEMLQRLRPSDATTGKPRDPSGEVFDSKTLQLLLRANDYPPFWRKKLEAISYRPIGLRQLGQLYQFGVLTQPQLVEGWQDLGFRKESAVKLAEMTARQNRVRLWKAQVTGIKGKVVKAYETGTITRDDAAVRLYQLGLQDPDQLRALARLGPVESTRRANADLSVIVQLDAIDHAKQALLVEKAITATHKIFLAGKINALQAQNRLSTLGLTQQRIKEYLQVWAYELTPIHRELRSEQIVRLYREGILGIVDAQTRLVNLGWAAADATLLLAQAARAIQLDAAKARRAAATGAKERQRAAQAVVRAARSEHSRARAELARHGSPGQLERWLKKGLIGEREMLARLLALDWPLVDAQRAVADALLKARKQPESPVPVPQP